MRMPPLTNKTRYFYFGIVYLYVSLLYLVTNHIHYFQPRLLPLTPFDTWVPYLPWTGWIYVMVYAMPLLGAVLVSGEEETKRMIISFIAMTTCCAAVFIFFPTIYPRPTIPVAHSLANFALLFVQSVDTPANSMPSQHVAIAFLSAFFIQVHRKLWGDIAILFGILIAISTLTTKQHYVWDVVIGYSMARFNYLIVMGPWFRTRSKVAQ